MPLVTSNIYLFDQLNHTRDLLNLNCSLRLFNNNFVPRPGNVLIDFAEPTFPGYARQALTGVFPTPTKIKDGVYGSLTGTRTFISSTPNPSIIYGWFIADIFQVWVSGLFGAPFTIAAGSPLSFRIMLLDSSTAA